MTGAEARIVARDSVTIFSETTAIQMAILAAVNNCTTPGAFSTTVPEMIVANPLNPVEATITPVIDLLATTPAWDILSATATVAGTGYAPATTLPVVFAAPTATQAIFGSASTDGNSITGISILNGGSGYVVGELITITDLGSGGTGATAMVATVSPATGIITSVTIVTSGTGYTSNGAATIAAPSMITAQGTITTDANGDIPVGTVVTMTVLGAGYITNTAFTFTNPLGPFPGNVTFLPVSPMTTTVDSNNDGRPDSWMYYEVHVGLLTDPVISDQLAFVKSYFAGLGYNIQLQVNPHTMNTLQWQLIW